MHEFGYGAYRRTDIVAVDGHFWGEPDVPGWLASTDNDAIGPNAEPQRYTVILAWCSPFGDRHLSLASEARIAGARYRLRPATDAKFAEDRGDLIAHGLLTDRQHCGDRAVVETLGE